MKINVFHAILGFWFSEQMNLCLSFQFLVFVFVLFFVSKCFCVLFLCLFSCVVLNHSLRFVFVLHLLFVVFCFGISLFFDC